MRLLGIDPGSRVTGFGVLELEKGKVVYVASGCIRAREGDATARLKAIFEGVCEVVTTYQPQAVAIERVFFAKNADAAIKLGQARGAAVCAVLRYELPIAEYTALQIKQAVVGRGHADKAQVQHMVRALLGLDAMPPADAADALACALCHSHRISA